MQAFLFINLDETEQQVSYEQAVVKLVKENLPAVNILDLDAASDDLLLHYARKLVQEATELVVCLKANNTASPSLLIRFLDDLTQVKGQQLTVLYGENQRIRRILEARPQLNFKQVQLEADLLEALETFFS